jgi:hypothetical protein
MAKKKRKQQKSAAPVKPAPGPLAFARSLAARNPPAWRERSDLIIATIYLLAYWASELPTIRYYLDINHATYLLMTAVRINQGQVPFIDFVPWYGVLYHYFAWFWIRLMGLDIYAANFFAVVISPLTSVILLVASLRMLRVPWPGRLFAVAASGLWGLDRIPYTGSIRALLGLLITSWWIWGTGKPYARWVRLAAAPSLALTWLFTPEVGVYLAPVALLLALREIAVASGKERGPIFFYYAAGVGAAGAALLTLDLVADGMIRTYLQYINYLSSTVWHYGLPFPDAAMIVNDPRLAIYWAPIAVYAGALAWIALRFRQGGLKAVPADLMGLAVFGVLFWNSARLRVSPSHLLFASPPALAILAFFFAKPSRYLRRQILLAATVIVFIPFFNAGDYGLWGPDFRESLKSGYFKDWGDCMGVKVPPDVAGALAKLRGFVAAHPRQTFIFPLASFGAYSIGAPVLLPFDDLFYISVPGAKHQLLPEIEKIKPDFIVLDTRHLLWLLPGDLTDPLMDYVAANYRLAQKFDFDDGAIIVCEREDHPTPAVEESGAIAGPFTLDRSNNFEAEWPVPSGFTGGYAVFEEEFFYGSKIWLRFSLPQAKVEVDGQYHGYPRTSGHGRQQIRNLPGGGVFRAYLGDGAQKIKLTIDFPGGLNQRPRRVVIGSVKFYRFLGKPELPYTQTFFENGY